MPDIGSVTARINIKATGGDQAARQLDMAGQKVALLGQKLEQAKAKTAQMQSGLQAATQAAAQMTGGMENFSQRVATVRQRLDQFQATLQKLQGEQDKYNAVVASGAKLTDDQKVSYQKLEVAIEATLNEQVALIASSAKLLSTDEAITALTEELTDAMLGEIAASERLARAQANAEKQTALTAGSMSRFARIMNLLRNPRYLLTIEGMTFAFRELTGVADGVVQAFRALSVVTKGALTGFLALAALLAGGVFAAFKLVNSELAKTGQQLDRLQVAVDAAGLGGLTAQWDQLAERFHLTESAALTLERQVYGTVRALGFAGDEAIAITDAMAGLAQKTAVLGGPDVDIGQGISAVQALAEGSVEQFEKLANVDLSNAEKEIERLGAAADKDARAAILLQEAMAQIDQNVDFSNLENEAGTVAKTMGDMKEELAAATDEGFREITEAADNFANILQPIIPLLGKLIDALSEAVEWLVRIAQIIIGVVGVALAHLAKMIADTIKGLVWLGEAINAIPLLEVLVPDKALQSMNDAATAVDAFADSTLAISKYTVGVGAGTEKTVAFAKAIRTLSETRNLTADSVKRFVEATGQSNDELTKSIDYIRQHKDELNLTDTAIRLLVSTQDELFSSTDDVNRVLNETVAAARSSAQAFVDLNNETQSVKQGAFGLIDSWKSLTEAQAALDKDLTPQNVFAFWKQMDAFQQQAIATGVEGIALLRRQVQEFLAMGGDPAAAKVMTDILNEVELAAGGAITGQEELAAAHQKVRDEASLMGSTSETAFGQLTSSANDSTGAINSASSAVSNLRSNIQAGVGSINIPVVYSAGGFSPYPSTAGVRYPSTAGIRESPARGRQAGRSAASYGIPSGGLGLKNRSGAARALEIERSAAAQAATKLAPRAVTNPNWLPTPQGIFYSPATGGGAGGGKDDKATLAEIRRLVDEVNRAISIGIRGGIGIGTEGNVVPLDVATSLSGNGIQVGSIILKGVWDFTDPAAKRKLIVEIKDLLRQLEREQG